MDLIKNKIAREPEKVSRANWLELAKKDGRGIPQSTGIHLVKLLRGKEDTKTNYRGFSEDGVMLFFDEGGVEKQYFVPTYVNDKNSDNYGKFHYLFEKFSGIDEDTELEMEYIKKGKAGYVDVRAPGSKKQANTDDIPVVEDEIPPEFGG